MSKWLVCGVSLVVFGAAACSEDDGGSASNGASDSGMMSAADMGSTPSAGDSGTSSAMKSSFEVKSEIEGGGSETTSGEVEDAKASQQSGGASIAGDLLHLYLVAPNGTTITAIVQTSEAHTAPGTFMVGAPPEGTHVTWLDPANGSILESRQGRIVLEGCPRSVGEKISGRFEEVVFDSVTGNATRTVSGDFNLAVYAKAGDLFCAQAPMMPADMGMETTPDMGVEPMSCQADICEGGGVCCPFMPCVTSCQFNCLTQDPDCIDPFSGNPAACNACVEGCLDSCNVTHECRTALGAYGTCERAAGCDAIEDEDQQETCARTNCCAELEAAF